MGDFIGQDDKVPILCHVVEMKTHVCVGNLCWEARTLTDIITEHASKPTDDNTWAPTKIT
jgi:hypothetical protein